MVDKTKVTDKSENSSMHYTKVIAFLFFLNTLLNGANYPILSCEKYARMQHDIPYTFKKTKQNKSIFYFGANHSYNPDNEQSHQP